ncbi:hypothetical protein QWZ06_17145 [Chryseobacterium tructae]|uniref:LysM domain-containing protein n=1 Tax=Chryseobacterium tructae TaxID=1037380 RepID=A0ABV7Y1U6_9FLAO|nr:hypothetical protein [Chryseobacterium tructae]MDN3693886.1 hypothetical protein [Chryseobacterium tructae]
MQTFNKHIIRENETLKSIATLYDLYEGDLKFFHNNHCETKDIILINLKEQKELFIPRTAVLDRSKVVHFKHGNKLMFHPENSFYEYGVNINIENGGHKNELKYEASVRWLKTENRFHYFEIDRTSEFFINEEETNDIADILAYKTSKVLYPLYISVDETGKFNAIEDSDGYKARWETVKEDVYKEFEGEIVDLYCNKIENSINEPELLSLYLKNDYFLRTLFFGIYQSFGDNYKIQGLETFPITGNPREPQYKIELEIDPLKDDSNLINIEGNGILHEERSIQDFINNVPFPFLIEKEPEINTEGYFRLQSYVNAETSLPEFLYLECEIQLQKPKKVSVLINVLENTKSTN